MNIIVCIKQVPDNTTADIDPALYTIKRNTSKAVINPFDLHAIECALAIKDKLPQTKITAITMGPNMAVSVLTEALALGVDEACLICDKNLSGSDSLITAKVLSKAAEKINFDLIVCGQQSTDGDTAQVGPEMAALLNIPQCLKATNLQSIESNKLILQRKIANKKETVSLTMPALISTTREINNPRLIKFKNYQTSKKRKINIWNIQDLNIAKEETGIAGSPTKVIKINPIAKNNKTIFLDGTIKEKAVAATNILKGFME